METNNENNKRILKNSGFLYIRMLFLMAVGFLTTRKILEALGIEDLGIYNVVGSLIVMFDFVSSGLSNATQRYLNIGLGQNNLEKTRQYFSQSLFIHISFALFVALLAETVGIWFVKNILVIPSERLDAALMIVHFSVLAIILRFIKICYESDVIAREKMSIYAYISIIDGLGKLFICYAVIYCTTMDKLVYYGLLLLFLNLTITLLNVIYCSLKYKETHIRFYKDKTVYQELLSFIGINSFGVISWSLGKQGINVVINMFLGPAVNGARALATQLDAVVSQFAMNINVAVRPQLTKFHAQDKNEEMMALAHRATKYIFFISFVVSVPFLFQTENILRLWLKEVPSYTVVFVQILIFEVLFNILGSTYNNVSMSLGKIKNIQVYGRLITLSGLPISYIILSYYHNPYLPSVVMMVLTLVYSVFIVYDIDKHLNFGLNSFYKNVIWPIMKVMFISIITLLLMYKCLITKENALSFIINSMFACCITLLICFYIGMNTSERNNIKCYLKNRK